jgi:hypothetical protein
VSQKPGSELEPAAVEHWLFRIEALPRRLLGLLTRTPGLRLLFEEGPGVAVEYGYSHPFNLAACPVFGRESLSLFLGAGPRGKRVEPIVVEKLPALVDAAALVEPAVGELAYNRPQVASASEPSRVSVELRVVPSSSVSDRPVASRLGERDLALLRRLAYVLDRRTLRTTRVAMTSAGLFLIGQGDLDPFPLGELHASPHPRMYVPVGWEVMPRVAAGLVVDALGRDADTLYFFDRNGGVLGLDPAKFVSLEQSLLQPGVWVPAQAQSFAEELRVELPTLWLDSLPRRPVKAARGFEE